MKVKRAFGILLVLIFVSCSSSSPKSYKLTDEQLANLMFDIQLAEVTIPDMISEKRDTLRQLFYKRLEEIYHLSEDELKKEIDQLQSDPEKLKWVVNKTKEMADSIQ